MQKKKEENCGVKFFQLRNIFFFFNLSKIHYTEMSMIFPVSSSMGNKEDFRKKKTYKVTS